MKLIVQIPSYNEERTLPTTLDDLPRSVPGFDSVEWLVIDDGSTDRTAEVARAHGADHVLQLPRNRGLARAFLAGLDAALRLGADVIVNTDADNQYRAADIPRLVGPILSGRADMVVGARPILEIGTFSRGKKLLQRLGSWTVRAVSGTSVRDAPSGFRALSRRAALQQFVVNRYTYTLESLIQAGQKGLLVESVPVEVNPPERDSRLIRSTSSYVLRSVGTILRFFAVYRPLLFFLLCSLVALLPGVALGLRFLYYFVIGDGQGHVQSLLLAAVLLVVGALIATLGIIADLISINRRLLEEIRYEARREAFVRQPQKDAGGRTGSVGG